MTKSTLKGIIGIKVINIILPDPISIRVFFIEQGYSYLITSA